MMIFIFRSLLFLMLAIGLFNCSAVSIASNINSPESETGRDDDRRWSMKVLQRAEIDHRRYCAWLDTGCKSAAVHSLPGSMPFPNYSSQDAVITTGSGRVTRRIFRQVPSAIVGFPQMPLDIVATDMTVFASCECWGIEAIIGMEYLRHFVLTIRGREGISSLDRVLVRQPLGQRIPLSFRDGRPHLKLTMAGGFSQDVMLDTGQGPSITFPAGSARRLVKSGHAMAVDEGTSFTLGGKVAKQAYLIRWSEIANVRFTDVRASETEESHPAIGLGLLDHFNCVFDFPKQEAWLEPVSDDRVIRLEPDASGLVVGFGPDGLALVRRLNAGYPAEIAKIEVGDELVSLNGRSAREFSYLEIERELSRTGKRVKLVLKRAEKTYAVDLKLARPYEYPPQWKPEDALLKTKFLPDDD